MEKPISHDKLLVTGACVRDELWDHVVPKLIVLMLIDNMKSRSSPHKLDYYKIDCSYFEYIFSEMMFVIQHCAYVEEITEADGTSTQTWYSEDNLLKFIQEHQCCVDLESMRYNEDCWMSKHGLYKIPIVWCIKGSKRKAYIVCNSDITSKHVNRRIY